MNAPSRFFVAPDRSIRWGVPGSAYDNLVLKPADVSADNVARVLNELLQREEARR